jgi:hypothetical protein
MTDLVVSQKALSVDGQNLFLDLVTMGADQGLLVNQAAEAFGIAPRTVQEHLKNHSLTCAEIPRESLKEMKLQGLVKANAPRAFFLPRETIRALAKVVNSNRAWEVYEQLWAVTDRAYEFHKKQQSEPPSPLDFLRGTLAALENQQQAITKLQCDMEDLNESIDEKIDQALHRDKNFPADCMTIDEIRSEFFPGVATSLVRRYLKFINHPRGSFRFITDDGVPALSRPFKRKDLKSAADRLFEESILSGGTEKNYVLIHPYLGKFFQHRAIGEQRARPTLSLL